MRVLRLNNNKLNSNTEVQNSEAAQTELVDAPGTEGAGIVADFTNAINSWDSGYTLSESDGGYLVSSQDRDLEFFLTVDTEAGTASLSPVGFGGALVDSRQLAADSLSNWMQARVGTYDRILNSSLNSNLDLNADLTGDQTTRLKQVYKMAQESFDMSPDYNTAGYGFKWTAFRTLKEIESIVSTLMYFSKNRKDGNGKPMTSWDCKGALACDFSAEETWTFDPDAGSEAPSKEGNRGYASNAKSDDRRRVAQLKIDPNSKRSPDVQAASWLGMILQNEYEDVLENPANRMYVLMLADGIIHKKNLANMAQGGIKNLLKEGLVDGVEVVKAKPEMARFLVTSGYITGEQAYKADPKLLQFLVDHDYIPAARAAKLDDKVKNKLSKSGKLSTADVSTTNVSELVAKVEAGEITAQDAWSANEKSIKPLVEKSLITPEQAYRLEPSILNWLLENHHVGRAFAQKMKPTIKKEMTKKGVDWESLDASLDNDSEGGYTLVESKEVEDFDGFMTEYCWYRDDNGNNVFVFGDSDLYKPEDGEWDYETDDDEDAYNWFKNYTGASELDSSLDEVPEDVESVVDQNSARKFLKQASMNASKNFFKMKNSGKKLNASCDSEVPEDLDASLSVNNTRFYEKMNRIDWDLQHYIDGFNNLAAEGTVDVTETESGLLQVTFNGPDDAAASFWENVESYGADYMQLMERSEGEENMDEWYDADVDQFEDFSDV